ncbi:MAG: hypothetical protein HY675_20710, partial [Chloroflexi bacterium]|nr:hypothetical protein [Chloroflexota bacterium]
MAEQITREERRRLHAAEMDANMVALVRALNAFAGIRTLGSCGGHAVVANPTQYPEG